MSSSRKSATSSSLNVDDSASVSVQGILAPVKQFVRDSDRLIRRCTKPDVREFKKIAFATSIGFLVMGFLGFVVKLVHIPINNILVGSA